MLCENTRLSPAIPPQNINPGFLTSSVLNFPLVKNEKVADQFLTKCFKIVLYFFQAKGTWKWSDGRPVGMTLWGPPFSPPLPTGRSCYTDNSSSQSNCPSTC